MGIINTALIIRLPIATYRSINKLELPRANWHAGTLDGTASSGSLMISKVGTESGCASIVNLYMYA